MANNKTEGGGFDVIAGYIKQLQPVDCKRLYAVAKLRRVYKDVNQISMSLSSMFYSMKLGRLDTKPYKYTLPDYPGTKMHIALPVPKAKPKKKLGSDQVLPAPLHLTKGSKDKDNIVIEIKGKRITIEDINDFFT